MSATAVKTAAPPYLKGFETLNEEGTIDRLEVTGELPAWLAGSLLRTGPARFEVGEHGYRHWFDGLTMLHRFSFGDGDVSYGNRYLRGKTWKAAEETGEIPYPEFATDPCRSVFKRIQTDVLTRLRRQREHQRGPPGRALPDDDRGADLSPVRPADARGRRRAVHAAGDGHHRAPSYGPRDQGHAQLRGQARPAQRVPLLPPRAGLHGRPRCIAQIPVKHPGYVHSFGLTENYIVFAEFPWVVNPLKLALAGRPYAENFEWEPERGTRFFLVDRRTGKASEPITTDPCFAFHHLNAYEEADGTIVADIQTYPDASIVDEFYLDHVRGDGVNLPETELRRFRIDPGAKTIEHEAVLDTPMELGRINYGRCNERPYRYAWGVVATPGNWIDRIVKGDRRGPHAHRVARAGRLSGRAGVRRRAGRRGRGRGRRALSRPRLRARDVVPAGPRRIRSVRGRSRERSPITSRSTSTGSSAAASSRLRRAPG